MWDGYHNFAEFREAYEREYNEKPYISPVQTEKWYDNLLLAQFSLPSFSLSFVEKNNHNM